MLENCTCFPRWAGLEIRLSPQKERNLDSNIVLFFVRRTFSQPLPPPFSLQITAQEVGVYRAYGLKPQIAAIYDGNMLKKLRETALANKAIALGGFGLNYTSPTFKRAKQEKLFRDQLKLALEMGLPFAINLQSLLKGIKASDGGSGDAYRCALTILKEVVPASTTFVVQNWVSDWDICSEFKRYFDNVHFSFSVLVDIITEYDLVKVVEKLPMDKILVESLSPQFGKKNNHPGLVLLPMQKISEIKGLSLLEVAAQTTKNAERVYKLDLDKHIQVRGGEKGGKKCSRCMVQEDLLGKAIEIISEQRDIIFDANVAMPDDLDDRVELLFAQVETLTMK